MGGNEVISKFLLISYKTSLKSPFSWDPFTISLISHSLPYGYPVYLISMEIYLQGLSWCVNYMACGPFSMDNIGIYQIMATNKYCQYISTLSEITPIWTFPPSTIQVL